MEVLIPRHSGFCPGVKKAEEKLFIEKNKTQDKIHILGQLIHNSNYIQFLSQQGMHTIEDTAHLEDNQKLVIRTHGLSKEIEEKLRKRHQLIDLTCYTVKRLQLKLQDFSKKGFFIVLTGKKDHPEVLGLMSYVKDFFVIEKEEEIAQFIDKAIGLLKEKNYDKILIASQTTGEEWLFNLACEEIIHKLSKDFKIEFLNSICPITSIREKEALMIQNKVDITFVIGDKKSSNSKKIYAILKKNNPETYFIEDLDALVALKLNLNKYKKAQVVASSSTPDFIHKKVCEFLENI